MNAELLLQAATEYQRRKMRLAHPVGKSDGKRWYPADTERRDCCDGIRSPSAAYPWSYMTHCRTAEHVARMFDVDVKDLRRVARTLEIVDGTRRRQ